MQRTVLTVSSAVAMLMLACNEVGFSQAVKASPPASNPFVSEWGARVVWGGADVWLEGPVNGQARHLASRTSPRGVGNLLMGSSSVSNRATSFRSSASGARSGRLPTTRMVSAQADSSATNQPPQETQALPESPGHPMLDPFEDGVVYEELSEEGCDACSEAECEGCAACDGCACGGPCLEPEWFGPPWAWPWWYGGPVATLLSRTELFAGVHGFKSAPDRGRNGNFGFHEGFNAGGPLGDPWGIGWQFGFRAAHSDFAGTRIDSYDPASRNQFFLTTGLFHRKSDCGLQWAVVFDYLHDNYYGSADLQQLRTEMSWKFLCGHEIGFWGAFMTGDDQYDYGIRGQPYRRDVESRDLYTIFYRQTLTCGGEWRAFAGFSGQGNGLFGADILLPAGQVFAFEGGFSYLIPKEATSTAALAEESWAVTLSLVWYPVRGNSCALTDPFRPLLPVADNRYLIQRLP